uniref:Uncharacterized protein n=1 Tax=Micrurus corallinus TaxID=54390 RepID=A0A2D4EW23_MICCO
MEELLRDDQWASVLHLCCGTFIPAGGTKQALTSRHFRLRAVCHIQKALQQREAAGSNPSFAGQRGRRKGGGLAKLPLMPPGLSSQGDSGGGGWTDMCGERGEHMGGIVIRAIPGHSPKKRRGRASLIRTLLLARKSLQIYTWERAHTYRLQQ